MEIFVRIAYMKYVEKGKVGDKSNARAVHRLFNEHVVPLLQQKILPQWQPFRDQVLWTNSVNDLLQVNLQSIKILYKNILDIRVLKPRFVDHKATSSMMVSID